MRLRAEKAPLRPHDDLGHVSKVLHQEPEGLAEEQVSLRQRLQRQNPIYSSIFGANPIGQLCKSYHNGQVYREV